jgi:hypothetical protein
MAGFPSHPDFITTTILLWRIGSDYLSDYLMVILGRKGIEAIRIYNQFHVVIPDYLFIGLRFIHKRCLLTYFSQI